MAKQDGGTIRLHGHVYERLDNFRRDDESFSEATDRLLPEDADVLEHPEEDVMMVWLSLPVHERVMDAAGENVSANEVIDHYLKYYE